MSIRSTGSIRAFGGGWRLLAAALLVGCLGVTCDAQSVSADEVRAAFLFTFSKFVQWPPSAMAELPALTIGVIGDDRIADALHDIVSGKTIAGHPVIAKRLAARDSLADVQILFISTSEKPKAAAILQGIQGISVLTVSDLDQFCQMGGVIQFKLDHDRMRFDINIDAADRAGLTINSKLLALARTIVGTKVAGDLR